MNILKPMIMSAVMLFSAGALADSAIRLVNNTSTPGMAEVHLFQGEHRVANVSVPNGGHISIDTTQQYTITATTLRGSISLATKPLKLKAKSATVEAAVKEVNGHSELEITSTPTKTATGLTIINHWKDPIQVVITKDGNPFHVTTTVEDHGQRFIEGGPKFSAYAIVNDVMTSKVDVPSANGTVTVKGSQSSGYTIVAN